MFYVDCFLSGVDLMLFPIQSFFIVTWSEIIKHKTNFAQTFYSDVNMTLVIFNKTCIASGHFNQYENKQW